MILEILFLVSLVGLVIYFFWVAVLFAFPKKKINYNLKDGEIEKYSLYVLMPMLDERNVVRKTVKSFFKEYQSEGSNSLDINLVIIDDGSKDGTTDILHKMECEHPNLTVVYRRLPFAQQGKSEALNHGLAQIRKNIKIKDEFVIIGVLDADAFMSISSFKKVVEAFALNRLISMVQVTVGMIATKGWLHWMQDMEFQSCNYLIQNSRNYFKNAAGSGNGQFFRLSDVDRGKVWQGSLLEDFEFSTNLLMKGQRTLYLEDSIVYQEPVSSIKALYKQRTRWCQGGVECFFKYSKSIWENKHIGRLAKFEMFFYMVIPFVTSLSMVGNIFALGFQFKEIVVLKGSVDKFLIGAFLLSMLVSLYLGYLYAKRSKRNMLKSLIFGLTIPVYNIILGPISYIAIYRYGMQKNEWSKTEHGIDKSLEIPA